MSTKPYKGFEPKWLLTPAPEGSYRSIFRWGDPEFFKYPKESLYKLMKETFKMTDDDFKDYSDDIGFDRVDLSDYPSKIAPEHIEALKKIVGDEFVTTEDYPRLSVAYGCTGYALRAGGEIAAFCIGEAMGDTLIVHIEKAKREYKGAFQMINCLFAKTELEKCGVQFINREDDVGDEGLRQAKQSYFPEYMLKKFRLSYE